MPASPAAASTGLTLRGLRSPHGGPYDLTVEPGRCIVVQGASGSGKSVLLRLIADLDPNDGEVTLDGRSRSTWPAPDWRRLVVYQAAESAWWAATAAGHFARGDRAEVDALMQRLSLPPATIDTDIARLSTGERQRFALLRSLLRQPRVLLLDEPTASLDPESIEAVEALLRDRLAQGLAIVLVTHSEAQSQRIADQRFSLRDRQLHPR